MTIKINPLYVPVLSSKCRYFHLWGGRSRGGSHFATDYFLMLITAPKYFRGGFLRATFGEVKNSLWRAFKDRVMKADEEGYVKYADFKFNDTELSVTYVPTGNNIISKGFRKTNLNAAANLKSLEGLTHAIIEEAEDVAEDEFMKFDDSLRTVMVENIQLIILFNPPHKNHWLIKRHYNLVPAEATNIAGVPLDGWYKAIPKNIPELLAIHSTYKDNSKNVNQTTKNNYRSYGDPDSPRYNPDFFCRNVLGLVSEGMKGRILTHVKPMTLSLFRDLPYNSFYGLDWGFNDPNAVIECKYHNGKLFWHELVYKAGMDNEELMIAMRQKQVQSHSKVYYDCARPDNAKTFKKGIEYGPKAMKGFNMIPSLKGADSIVYGIRELQNVEIFATDCSENLWKEIEEYHWALDGNKEPTDDPEDEHNHLIDAGRYAYIGEVKKRGNISVGDNDDHRPSMLDLISEQKVGRPLHRDDMPDRGEDLDDDDIDEFHR